MLEGTETLALQSPTTPNPNEAFVLEFLPFS